MRIITERAELVDLARELGVRPDWHEPDEQGLTARVYGESFDNAMPPAHWYGKGDDNRLRSELHVVLYRSAIYDGREVATTPIAAVSLATLFAWATGYDQPATGCEHGRQLEVWRNTFNEMRTIMERALGVTPWLREPPTVPAMLGQLVTGYVAPDLPSETRAAANPEDVY